MLRWSFFFLVVGVVAGFLGFTGIAGTATGIAKFLFFAFIAVWVFLLALGYALFKK